MARSSIYPPSVTPGLPCLGELPDRWLETTYGNVLEQVTRKAKIEDDQKYQLVTAKRSRGGIVPRSILYGKEIKTEAQFYICSDDFLISKRQIIHGACGIVPTNLAGAIVSGEYSVLRVKSDLLLAYLKYHCHTVYFQQTCFQSSVGVDVEKMIFDLDQWFKFKVHLPPLPEQRKIADILSTWNEAIELTEQLIAAKQKRKQALMQRLLTGQVRFPGFNEVWESVTIGDICNVGRGRVISKNYIDANPGDYPVYSSQTSSQGIFGYINSFDFEGEYVTWTTDGANAGEVFYRTGRFNCTNVCGTLKNKDNTVNLHYLAYALSRVSKKHVSRNLANPKLMNGVMAQIVVSLPSIEEQKKIAGIIKYCDQEIDLLQQKLTAFRQQKKGLMQQLLTGKIRVKV